MNFLREINAFEDWLETNPIPDTAQLMWYKLMNTNNKCGWIDWFDLANTTLMAKMNISSDKTLNTARNILVDKGRIRYKSSGNRIKAGKYSIISFDTPYTTVKNTIETEIEREVVSEVEQGVGSGALNKLNKTKLKDNLSLIFSKDSIEYKMALELKNYIISNNPRAKVPDESNLQKWAVDVDRLLRIDKRSENDIRVVISFSQKDNFWKSNILSVAKLREKFDTLFLQATTKKDIKSNSTNTVNSRNRGNFEQRKYDDDYYDNLYKNTKKAKED